MYYRPRVREHGFSSYIMPFLIIICVGVIIVLLYNLFKAFFVSEPSGDAYMHIDSGSVQIMTWGTDDFFNLTSDALIMKGDEIRTSADAKVIIEFFDGTLMRLNGSTDVVLNEINNEKDSPSINILLVDGKLWFNKLYKDTADTYIEVKMTNTVVKSSTGNIFELENGFEEIVRIFHGDEIGVDILTEDGKKVVENEKIGVGQEIVFTDKVFETYWQYQSPSVLSALSDEFKQTPWYLWNTEEDKAPTEFSKSAILGTGEEFVESKPEIINEVPKDESKVEEMKPEVVETTPVEGVTEEKSEEEVETPVDLGPLTVPTISSVSGGTQVDANGFYFITSNLATLTGGVSGAEKVVVNGYTLQKFIPGDLTWTYYANADYGLMQAGENTYEIYALAPDGTKSESIFVKVLYQPLVIPTVEEETIEEEVPAETSGNEEEKTAEDTENPL